MAKKIALSFITLIALVGILEIIARCMLYQRQNRYPFALVQWSNDLKVNLSQPATQSPSAKGLPEELMSYVNSPHDIKAFFPDFIAQQIAFGNTPFRELRNETTSSTYKDKDGNLFNKPSVAYDLYYLRSRIYNPYDPIVLKANAGDKQTGKVLAFRERYALQRKRNTIDANGDRITIPASTSSNIILVVGDSVAFGAGLSDEETLSSQLQNMYPSYRFVNVGVSGCNARANVKRLADRLTLFGPQVKGVIYVHCENDFEEKRHDDPGFIVASLSHILDKASIHYRILIYQAFVYRTMPDLFRERSQHELCRYYNLKHDMLTLAQRQGMATIDFYPIVDQYRKEMGTPLAGMSLYVDHCHFSALGTKLVAEAIPPPDREMPAQ